MVYTKSVTYMRVSFIVKPADVHGVYKKLGRFRTGCVCVP